MLNLLCSVSFDWGSRTLGPPDVLTPIIPDHHHLKETKQKVPKGKHTEGTSWYSFAYFTHSDLGCIGREIGLLIMQRDCLANSS